MMSFAFAKLLETICSRELENTHEFLRFKERRQIFLNSDKTYALTATNNKFLLTEQMGNLAEIVMQLIMLDQHYIDYQWPSSNSNESEESLEAEVEAIKLYIER